MKRPPEFDDVEVLGLDENEEEEELMQEIGSERRRQALEVTGTSAFKKPKVLPPQSSRGPIDCYFSPRPAVLGKNMRQTTIDENSPAKKELRERACVAIARWMYDVGIAFNAVNYDSFGEMIRTIENYGKEMKPPSFHEVRVRLLNKEVQITNDLLESHKEEWENYGCTLMCDGWTDRKGRTLINFLANSLKGSVFIKSVDASDESKTAALLTSLIEKELMEIGSEKVVQVVTNNASNNVAAGRILEANFSHLYWTPCAAHCIDLMLEDIFKIRVFKETFRKAVELTGFTYGSSGVLNMLRKFTNGVELLRPGQTRFATAFITLGRIHLQKANIRKMFTSESWTTSKWAKEVKGKKYERTVLSPAFWNHIVYALKVSGPLVHVLRLVDNEKKSAMGYIYEAMDRAKEAIANSLNGNEEKYKSIFEIIDARWSLQLHRPLHVFGYFLNPEFFYPNKMRIESDEEVNTGLLSCIHKMEKNSAKVDMILDEIEKYKATLGPLVLSLTCSASSCERNLSVFEHLHSKKRNRLFQERLDNLVYVKYNRALLRRHTFGDITTPIDLANIDESNEWLLGELEKGDGDDDDDNSLIFMNDVLTWGDVGRAAGVSESRYESRSAARSTLPVETLSFRRPRAMTGASSSQVDDDEEEEEFVMAVVENEDDFGNLDDE
ncbi:uncharacterized protein LOC131181417 [Hevea brasiliensis]|uniref:uncharacterized protein LOC131181417 n=1 Tax=Hevea brasiliensis TaxID=3981 RepID=UPI0025FA2CF1|nr:uncharacterized protein LOC131181417 [Hevea brasiliensis]